MAKKTCDNCNNSYDKSFTIILNDKDYVFDSFECAINMLAPKCFHCKTRIIGHGVEDNEYIFCCANCARHTNSDCELKDRIER